jgi:hypothetical protein
VPKRVKCLSFLQKLSLFLISAPKRFEIVWISAPLLSSKDVVI